MAARFFPSLRIVKNKHEKKNFCPDKKKILLKFFSRKIIQAQKSIQLDLSCKKKKHKKIQNNYTITNF